VKIIKKLMARKKFIAAILAVAVLTLGGYGCEGKAWREAKRQETEAAYREYLAKYPQGKHALVAATRLESSAWSRTKEKNTIAAYLRFEDEYPDSSHAKIAREEIKTLKIAFAAGLGPEQLAAARVTVETSAGNFTLKFYPEAPGHARNLIRLALFDFYVDQQVNWVDPGRAVHLGDPGRDGLGGPGHMIPAEFNDRLTQRGSVVMTHLPQQPDTAGSQFTLCLSPLPEYDGQNTIFGEVTDGLSVLDIISAAPGKGPPDMTIRVPVPPIEIHKLTVTGIKLPD
jgi:peptidyl-prolyl cis-trans isomerase B (cyclophilin B)